MNLIDKISNRFYQTPVFKGLVHNYIIRDSEILAPLVKEKVSEELNKARQLEKNEAFRYRLPYNINSNINTDTKMYSVVPMSFLRQLAQAYPIARACINRRVRQITQLKWDIAAKEGKSVSESQVQALKEMFETPMGENTRMRELLTLLVDDILTIDATSFEIQKTRKGDYMYLVPVDPTTIALRVTETGETPVPPMTAYEQYIYGKKVAEFTTDELIYEVMNPRSFTPYGLAPLESLITQVESALRGSLYNLGYLKEGNTPEGFLTLPETEIATKDQVEEWQMWFDSIMAGDPRMIRRLKVLPHGAEYTPTKKPEDMSFEKFEIWLLQQTCAVFDVQPQDIGITYQVNRSTSDTQRDIGNERGLYPLANFVKEIFDDIIQRRMGIKNAEFIWVNINPVDRKEESDIFANEVKLGAMSVDEYRESKGLEPIGLGHFIMTSKGPVMVADVLNPQSAYNTQDMPKDSTQGKTDAIDDEPKESDEEKDLKLWRKCVYKDIEQGKTIRTKFKSTAIDPDDHKTISEALAKVHSKSQAKLLFDQFLNPEIKASMRLLDLASKIRKTENVELI